MPRFYYQATDASGTAQDGSIDAADRAAAQAQLTERGWQVIWLSAVSPTATAEALSTSDAHQLAQHLVELSKAGVPLASGLTSLAAELPPGALARTIDRLGKQLALGTPLETAVAGATDALPVHIRGLLAAGLRTGKMGEVLEGVLHQQRSAHELGRRVWLALSYPLLLLVALTAWVLFVFEYIVPQMHPIFEECRSQVNYNSNELEVLPIATQVVIALSQARLPLLLLGALGVLAIVALAVRLIAGKAIFSEVLNAVPLVGPLRRYRHLTAYCNLLALLVDEQLPLPEALELSAGGVRDAAVARASRLAADAVQDGSSFSQAIARLPAFPITLQPLVQWGEQQSLLSEGLRSGAQFFQRRMDLQAAFLTRVLPPFVFVLILTTATFVSVALILPMVKWINGLLFW